MSIKTPTKKAVQQRDTHQCRKCKAKEKLQLHHVVPQRLNGPDEDFNLVCLCQKCHTEWHKLEKELDIAYMEKRVVETFYKWLKEDKNADKHLKDCKFWNSFKQAQKKGKK